MRIRCNLCKMNFRPRTVKGKSDNRSQYDWQCPNCGTVYFSEIKNQSYGQITEKSRRICLMENPREGVIRLDEI